MKDGKAPERIRWKYEPLKEDKVYVWYDYVQGYYEENHAGEIEHKFLRNINEQYSRILNSTVEILPEEKEWEDIEKINVIKENYEEKLEDK